MIKNEIKNKKIKNSPKKLIHDEYGKNLLKELLKNKIKYIDDTQAHPDYKRRVDAVIPSEKCVIEIESRTPKQIRGAIMDLFFHDYDKKLLILIPAHLNNPINTEKNCNNILNELQKYKRFTFKVALLNGKGDQPNKIEDLKKLEAALKELFSTSDEVLFFNSFGSWQDIRNADEIIKEIYASRNFDRKRLAL